MNFFVLYIHYMYLLKAILYNIFSTHTFCDPSHEVSVEFSKSVFKKVQTGDHTLFS